MGVGWVAEDNSSALMTSLGSDKSTLSIVASDNIDFYRAAAELSYDDEGSYFILEKEWVVKETSFRKQLQRLVRDRSSSNT